MSENLQADHQQFREIVAGYCARFLEDFPSFAKEDWMVQCYQSIKVFEKKYPTPEDRDKCLLHLTNNVAEARQLAKQFIKEFFHDDPETGDVLVGKIGEPMIRTQWATKKPSLLQRIWQWIVK